jgi:hypothetical protein
MEATGVGGDFYAMSDAQLMRLLDGTVHFGAFLYGEAAEQPRECYSEAAPYWQALLKLLAPEDGCGSEVTDTIPEASGYSYAEDVAFVAAQLAGLSDETLQQRYLEGKIEIDFESLLAAVKGVIDFYQRAAQHGEAVLFRVA